MGVIEYENSSFMVLKFILKGIVINQGLATCTFIERNCYCSLANHYHEIMYLVVVVHLLVTNTAGVNGRSVGILRVEHLRLVRRIDLIGRHGERAARAAGHPGRRPPGPHRSTRSHWSSGAAHWSSRAAHWSSGAAHWPPRATHWWARRHRAPGTWVTVGSSGAHVGMRRRTHGNGREAARAA